MNEDSGTLRAISWRDLCPWFLLFRVFGLAIRVEVLLLAALGVLLSAVGWWLTGMLVFLGDPPPKPETNRDINEALALARGDADVVFAATYHQLQRLPGERVPLRFRTGDMGGGNNIESAPEPASLLWNAAQGGLSEPLIAVWKSLSSPWHRLFDMELTPRRFLYFALGALVSLFIWAIIGGAITRSAAMQLGREERLGLRKSVWFAIVKLPSLFAAPLFPILGILLFAMGVFVIVGLPMGFLGDVGVLWGGIVWFLVLIFAALIAALTLGLIFGWPLMWATICSEGTDAFDALSRSYAYTFQRPLHYLFYAAVAGFVGALGWLLVLVFGELVIHLAWWAASWGIGNERLAAIAQASAGADVVELGSIGQAGAGLIGFFDGVVRTVTYSFAFAFFWTAAAAIYLLLRRDVDQTEIDEVYADDEDEVYGMPPIEKDLAGVAGAADMKPGSASMPPPDMQDAP